MNKLVGAVAFLLCTATMVAAQGLSQLYSRPAIPAAEVLQRLNLKLAWGVYVPLESRRDGLFSVQVLDKQVLVQARSGAMIALDPATGVTQWRTRGGKPYLVSQPLAYNSHSVFQVNGGRLFAFERATGLPQWNLVMPGMPTAPPVADEEHVFLATGAGRFTVYALPRLGPLASGKSAPGGDKKVELLPEARREGILPYSNINRDSVSPLGGPIGSWYLSPTAEPGGIALDPLWEYHGQARVEQAPLLFQEYATITGTGGGLVTLSKTSARELYSLQNDAPVSAPLAQHGAMAYYVTADSHLTALEIPSGRIVWRSATGSSLFQKPEVTDEDVYVGAERGGLMRIKRPTGETVWRHPLAHRFLAANGKFVYATDRQGRLLILDRARGHQLAGYDTRDFVVPVSNEWTDRLYLASNDGLLVCLHDRAYRKPLRTKTTEEQPKPANGKAETPPTEKSEEKLPER
jgi:outer membrane protein assembly factor BamB